MAQNYLVRVSCATGTSINTSFSMVGSGPNGDFFYHASCWNESPSGVYIAIATTLPTSTTTDKFYLPAYSTSAKDGSRGEGKYMISPGHNVYAACAITAIVSSPITIEFW